MHVSTSGCPAHGLSNYLPANEKDQSCRNEDVEVPRRIHIHDHKHNEELRQ